MEHSQGELQMQVFNAWLSTRPASHDVPALMYQCCHCRSLPLTVEPCTGTLQPGSSSSISLQLAAAEVGAIVGELAVSVAGRTEPYRQSINAAVVQQSFELIDASHVGISEVSGREKLARQLSN